MVVCAVLQFHRYPSQETAMVYFMFFVLIRKKAQYENIDADIVQGEEEPQIAEEKGDRSCALMS